MDIGKNENSIDFDKVEHDFGRIKKNTIIQTTFAYTGKKQIVSLKESCMCLSYRKTKFLDRIEITVWWNTAKSINKSNKFKSFKQVVVTFDDKTTQGLTLIAEVYE